MKNVSPQLPVVQAVHPVATDQRSSSARSVYDERYEKDNDVTILGIFLFLIPILFMVFCSKKGSVFQDSDLFMEILLGSALLFRIFASFYVARMAGDLNRNVVYWVSIAVLAPGSALMIIGQKKRFLEPVNHTAKNNYPQLDSASLLS